jgi:lipopolysaccharide/colanic/teichoic acid biosynthesis glycosyltransferase
MSAHPIAEPHFVDAPDVTPNLGAAGNSHARRDRHRNTDTLYAVSAAASVTAGRLMDVNPWLVSASRRCFDSAAAASALLLLSPVIVLIMLVVRLTSPGPIFFRQRRTGRNRVEFMLYKFRSMRVEETPGPPITVSGDPRITPVGMFLRRYKLDELPQFWNVLKGDMSLVGPRPKLPHHELLDLPYRPGITGLATLAFRNEEEILCRIPPDHLDAFYELCVKPRKARLDLAYMQSATFWTDLNLIWRTAASCAAEPNGLSFEETEELIRLAEAWLERPAGTLSAGWEAGWDEMCAGAVEEESLVEST